METKNEQSPVGTMVAYGQVVTVRPVPTRQVTQIVIEIPDDFHIPATSMLFGKNAFVLAATDKARGKFGVVPLGQMEGKEEPTPSNQEPSAKVRLPGGLSVNVNSTKWLGEQCQNMMFMSWIGAESTSQAIAKVREICGVESRSEIPKNQAALEIFIREIYLPFNAHINANAPAKDMAWNDSDGHGA